MALTLLSRKKGIFGGVLIFYWGIVTYVRIFFDPVL